MRKNVLSCVAIDLRSVFIISLQKVLLQDCFWRKGTVSSSVFTYITDGKRKVLELFEKTSENFLEHKKTAAWLLHTAVFEKRLFVVFETVKDHCIAIVSVIQRTVYPADGSGGCAVFLGNLQIGFSVLEHFCYLKSL